MKFSISSARSSDIKEYLDAAGIKCLPDAVGTNSRGDKCAFVEIKTMDDLIVIQQRVESFRSSKDRSEQFDAYQNEQNEHTPLVINFTGREITIYDFYMD